MINTIKSIDKEIILSVDKYFTNEVLLSFFNFFSTIGHYALVWFFLFIIISFHKKEKALWLFWGISFAALFLLSELLLKNLICRPRPFIELSSLNIVTSKPSSFSFPSSHALFSGASLYIFFKIEENIFFRTAVFLLSILISLSRIILKVHYPSDVIAGFFLGIFMAFMVKITLNKIYSKDKIKK
jgi:undecaprenyl-diphosphatase